MTQRDLARLLVKIAAMVIFATAFTALPESLMQVLRSPDRPAGLKLIGMAFAPASVSMLAGLAMYWWAGPLVDRTLIGRNPVGAPADVDLRAFEEIALTVLGVYILSSGLAEGLYYWGKWYGLKGVIELMSGRKYYLPSTEFGGLLAAGTRVIVGLGLIAFSRGFITLKRRLLALRTITPGVQSSPSAPESIRDT
jgi:hypothetical protein